MHILMALWEGGGTVPVEVGIARRLVDAGHRVTVIAEPSMRPAVEAAGADFRSWVTAPHPVTEVVADWECTNPYALFRRLLDRLVTGPSALFAADVRAVAATARPSTLPSSTWPCSVPWSGPSPWGYRPRSRSRASPCAPTPGNLHPDWA